MSLCQDSPSTGAEAGSMGRVLRREVQRAGLEISGLSLGCVLEIDEKLCKG